MDLTPHSSGEFPSVTDDPQPPRAGLILADEEVRVLGCLIEKEHTTPDDYPLSANALMRACNQSTSRDPVVSYDQRTIEQTTISLKAAGFLRFVHMPTGRATTRYRHIVGDRLGLTDPEVVILGLLMLRGAQTVSELKTRSERLHAFDSLEDVTSVLAGLAARYEPLSILLERQPGQKELRWTHLLHGEARLPDPSTSSGGGSGGSSTAERIRELEDRVDALTASVSELRDALGLDG